VCAAVLGAVLAWLMAAWLTTKDAPQDSLTALRQGL